MDGGGITPDPTEMGALPSGLGLPSDLQLPNDVEQPVAPVPAS